MSLPGNNEYSTDTNCNIGNSNELKLWKLYIKRTLINVW